MLGLALALAEGGSGSSRVVRWSSFESSESKESRAMVEEVTWCLVRV